MIPLIISMYVLGWSLRLPLSHKFSLLGYSRQPFAGHPCTRLGSCGEAASFRAGHSRLHPAAFISWIIPPFPAEPERAEQRKSCLALGVREQRGGSQEHGQGQWYAGTEPGRGSCVLELHPHPAGPQTPTPLPRTSQGSCGHHGEQGLTSSCHPPTKTARTGCLLLYIRAMEVTGMRSPGAGDNIQHSAKSGSSSPRQRGVSAGVPVVPPAPCSTAAPVCPTPLAAGAQGRGRAERVDSWGLCLAGNVWKGGMDMYSAPKDAAGIHRVLPREQTTLQGHKASPSCVLSLLSACSGSVPAPTSHPRCHLWGTGHPQSTAASSTLSSLKTSPSAKK